jgi:hypothetical protein
MAAPVNLYNTLPNAPLVAETASDLCSSLNAVVDAATQPGSTARDMSAALDYVRANEAALLGRFSACAWTYACCQQQPPLSLSACLENTAATLVDLLSDRVALATQPSIKWDVARVALRKLAIAIGSGCCGKLPDGQTGARFVIRQAPNVAPYYGRTICVPTDTPAKLTERSYASRAECEMAVMQLPPQEGMLPFQSTIYCNEFGCFQQPSWGTVPQYGFDCDASRYCCGAPSAQQKWTKGFTPAQQYRFYS